MNSLVRSNTKLVFADDFVYKVNDEIGKMIQKPEKTKKRGRKNV